jgi:nucleoid-associated protein YgaU
VKRGESLWTIARDRLASAQGGSGEPTNREVARYWLRVVKANKKHLWSKDPDLIYPKEKIILPRPPKD